MIWEETGTDEIEYRGEVTFARVRISPTKVVVIRQDDERYPLYSGEIKIYYDPEEELEKSRNRAIIEERKNDGSHFTKDEHGRFTGSTAYAGGKSSGGGTHSVNKNLSLKNKSNVDKNIEKPNDSLTILCLEDIQIGRSVGAKAKNYDVYDPITDDYFHFAEGTRIQNSQVFAGKGVKKPLNKEVSLGLSERIGGKAENWQHCKGNGIIDFYGEERTAEVHWFQEESVGKHKFKVKRWLD